MSTCGCVSQGDPRALLDWTKAAVESMYGDRLRLGVALGRIRSEQLYKLDGYANFEAYCNELHKRGRAWASKVIKAGEFAEKHGLIGAGLSPSRAYIVASRITDDTTQEGINELVTRARAATSNRDFEEAVPEKGGGRPAYVLTFVFRDHVDAETARSFFVETGPKAVGTTNKQSILIAAIQEVTPQWLDDGEAGHAGLDPVTRATFERDGWMCLGCGKQRNLTRHSHLKPHSAATVDECITLCHEVDRSGCHDLYHDEKATIEFVSPGNIRFIKKDA